MTDDQIEEMIRKLIEDHLSEDDRQAALEWLKERVLIYLAMDDLGLVPSQVAATSTAGNPRKPAGRASAKKAKKGVKRAAKGGRGGKSKGR